MDAVGWKVLSTNGIIHYLNTYSRCVRQRVRLVDLIAISIDPTVLRMCISSLTFSVLSDNCFFKHCLTLLRYFWCFVRTNGRVELMENPIEQRFKELVSVNCMHEGVKMYA
jgi:hypothetical protein